MLKKEKRPRPPLDRGVHGEAGRFCQPTQAVRGVTSLNPLAPLCRSTRRRRMATDPLANVRTQVGQRIAEIRQAGPRLSPLDLHARMDAIRQLAADHGLAALEGLARCSAQMALLPGPPRRAAILPRACRRSARQPSEHATAHDPRRARRPPALRHRSRRSCIEARCAPSRSCSTTSSTRARATPSSS